MKISLFALSVVILGSNVAMANTKCLDEAKLHARLFSAKENQVSVTSIQVADSFFHSETNHVLNYGILLDNGEQLNVGLKSTDCSLSEMNYVANAD